VDSLQQGLLDPNTTAGGGGTSARHAPTGNRHTAPAGSLLLTQHQVNHTEVSKFSVGMSYFILYPK
jgi:hypothetical protein